MVVITSPFLVLYVPDHGNPVVSLNFRLQLSNSEGIHEHI